MDGRVGSVPFSSVDPTQTTETSGCESENSMKEEDNPTNCNGEPKLSEFIRNLPGLPPNCATANTNDVVSCVAASGPLEDNIEIKDAQFKDKTTHRPKTAETENSTKRKERHSDRHRSSRECRRCNQRRKLKRCNVGVQCKIDRHSSRNGIHQFSLSRSLHSSSSVPSWDLHKYASLMKVETYPNGNASLVHMYQDEIDRLNLCEKELRELADEFFKVFVVNQRKLLKYFPSIIFLADCI